METVKKLRQLQKRIEQLDRMFDLHKKEIEKLMTEFQDEFNNIEDFDDHFQSNVGGILPIIEELQILRAEQKKLRDEIYTHDLERYLARRGFTS